MTHPRKLIAAGLAGTLAVAGSLAASNAAMAWEPRKPVEFIIMAGTGGGADQMARMWQGLIEKKNLSSRPFIPINKPGGSGAEALRYLQDKEGDDHAIMVTLNSFYTTPITQEVLNACAQLLPTNERICRLAPAIWLMECGHGLLYLQRAQRERQEPAAQFTVKREEFEPEPGRWRLGRFGAVPSRGAGLGRVHTSGHIGIFQREIMELRHFGRILQHTAKVPMVGCMYMNSFTK